MHDAYSGLGISIYVIKSSVVDPEWFISDPYPDPTFQTVSDRNPDPTPDPEPVWFLK